MWSLNHLSIGVPSKDRYKTNPPSPNVVKSLIQVPRKGQAIRTKNKKTIVVGGHKDHASACLCHMLYCIEASSPYNLAFFILKRMEKTRNKPKELLPYRMLLTRLFKHVVSVSPELAFDHYLSHDRAMYPLAPHYERKTRSDHGKKRPRESNASSSSTTQNHPSSFLTLDAIVDEIDDESFHSNSSSSYHDVSSSFNVVHRVLKNELLSCTICMILLNALARAKTKKGCGYENEVVITYSSSAFDQPSSSHLNDDDDDGNDEGTSRASTPSPIHYVNSLTNQVPQVFQNPPNIDPYLKPFYT
ncbi:hypothetical protein Tco_0874591 [Tanacetum coccineum]|uniref:Pentatricopeptide repeat-containing protein n=1 Tax=Tanacetum coccineum TaxID=301880 RepID=A0ABQ5BM12_9ASTR